MRRNNLFAKFIITFSLVAFLTFSVGKVQRIYAMATTAAIAGAALLGTGAIYLGYLALTGGSISIPSGTGADIRDYLRDVGKKVAYYGSGAAIYNKLYSFLRSEGVNALDSYDVTWTQNDLLDLYNEFKDITLNQSITSFLNPAEVDQVSTTDFDYSFSFTDIPHVVIYNGTTYPSFEFFASYINGELLVSEYSNTFVFNSSTLYSIQNLYCTYPLRNTTDGTYYGVQRFYNGAWSNITGGFSYLGYPILISNVVYFLTPLSNFTGFTLTTGDNARVNIGNSYLYPVLPNSAIYDSVTAEVIDVIPLEDIEVVSPEYDDNENYPVVPYVQLPDGGNWGFNLGDLISEIINRAAQTITAVGIGDLINQFMNSLGGDTGDYIYYSDNDNNYYIYYSNVYQGDDYTTYNINIGDQQDVIPVDLNTIQDYTDNEYLDVVKERVNAFSDTVGSFVAFWHNIDFEIVYAVFGSALIVLLGAFIGKWGHS